VPSSPLPSGQGKKHDDTTDTAIDNAIERAFGGPLEERTAPSALKARYMEDPSPQPFRFVYRSGESSSSTEIPVAPRPSGSASSSALPQAPSSAAASSSSSTIARATGAPPSPPPAWSLAVAAAKGPAARAAKAEEPENPWDILDDGDRAVDLDVNATPRTLFDEILADSAPKPAAAKSAPLPKVQPAAPTIEEAPPATGVADECELLMTAARELFELVDFSGSLELVEKVLKIKPDHEGALAYLARNSETLSKMYESKIGDLRRQPKQLVPPDEVIWINMHHRAGFILAQVDGMLSYEDLLAVSGMPRFDTVRILANLVQNGIIG